MLSKTNIQVSQNVITKIIETEVVQNSLNNCTEKTSICINQPTGRFFYDKWEILPEYSNTCFERILNGLSKIGEARIVLLPPGTAYRSHSDLDDRYHLTLQSQQSYLVDLYNNKMYETSVDRYWYLMDTSPAHSAVNFGSIIRAQLVVRKLLGDNCIENPKTVSIVPSGSGESHKARFIFDKIISPWLNIANKKNKISNIKVENSNSKISFDIESIFYDELTSMMPTEFKITTHD